MCGELASGMYLMYLMDYILGPAIYDESQKKNSGDGTCDWGGGFWWDGLKNELSDEDGDESFLL